MKQKWAGKSYWRIQVSVQHKELSDNQSSWAGRLPHQLELRLQLEDAGQGRRQQQVKAAGDDTNIPFPVLEPYGFGTTRWDPNQTASMRKVVPGEMNARAV